MCAFPVRCPCTIGGLLERCSPAPNHPTCFRRRTGLGPAGSGIGEPGLGGSATRPPQRMPSVGNLPSRPSGCQPAEQIRCPGHPPEQRKQTLPGQGLGISSFSFFLPFLSLRTMQYLLVYSELCIYITTSFSVSFRHDGHTALCNITPIAVVHPHHVIEMQKRKGEKCLPLVI